jgi:DNA repair protein SbcC/Rad50
MDRVLPRVWIKKVVLHHFGGAINRSIDLKPGLQALFANNEYGKTTLREGIRNALFTPASLTPANLKNQIKIPWYPRPCGDHAKVELAVEVNQTDWTVHKQWGAGVGASLSSVGIAAFADDDRITEKICELLGHSKEVYECVFFLPQGQLLGTIEGVGGDVMQSAAEAANAVAAQAGIVNPETLRELVATKIGELSGRWDEGMNAPERQGRQPKEIGNEWRNRVGSVCRSYYDWAMANDRLELAQLLSGKLDEAQNDLDASAKELREKEVSRENLEAHRNHLPQEGGESPEEVLKRLQDDQGEWPSEAAIKSAADVVASKKTGVATLEGELRGICVQHFAKAFQNAELAKAAHEAFESPVGGDVERLEQIEGEIRQLKVSLDAHKLTGTVSAGTETTIQFVSLEGEIETVDVQPGNPITKEVSGQLTVRHQGLEVSVSTAELNVAEAEGAIQSLGQERSELMRKLGGLSLSDAKQKISDKRDLKDKHDSKQRDLEAAVVDRPEDEVAEGEKLGKGAKWQPSTLRGSQLVREEIDAAATAFNELDKAKTAINTMAAGFANRYLNRESLIEQITQQKCVCDNRRSEIAGLPVIDPPVTTLESLNRRVQALDDEVSQLQESKTTQTVNVRRAEIALTNANIPSLENDLAATMAAHQRERERLRHLRQIEAAINTVHNQDDHYGALREKLEHRLSQVFDRRYEIHGDDNGQITELAVTDKDDLYFEVARLSQGAKGSVGIAVRAAIADVFADAGNPGILILDDPLVDLDPGRRKLAIEVLKELGGKMQVIVLTCHPNHADEIGETVSFADKN